MAAHANGKAAAAMAAALDLEANLLVANNDNNPVVPPAAQINDNPVVASAAQINDNPAAPAAQINDNPAAPAAQINDNPVVPPAAGVRFPLSKAIMVEAAQPVITAALIATCTSLVMAQQGLDPTTDPHTLSVMKALLYAYMPVGLFALMVAVAVKRNHALVGLSSGFILAHFLLPTVIGGIVNVVKSGENGWIVGAVTVLLLILTVLAWGCLCSYPKFLRFRCCGAA